MPLPRKACRSSAPSQAAAEIEGSKKFAKDLMKRAGVPSAAYDSFSDFAAAEAFIDRQPGDVVVKADGLCAGKGVVVAKFAPGSQGRRPFHAGGTQLRRRGCARVIEERLTGRECSMMALCDGERFVLLATAEDHKAVFDGDRGPNTGGMGAYSPSPLVDASLTRRIAQTIFAPTVAAMAAMGRPFRGLLYGGLMLTPDRGPMVIEWNCRFGDPETQAVLRAWKMTFCLGSWPRPRASCHPARPPGLPASRYAWCWQPRVIRAKCAVAMPSTASRKTDSWRAKVPIWWCFTPAASARESACSPVAAAYWA